MEKLDCEVLGVDWTVNLAQARAQVGASKALQGNLDPAVLFAPPQQVAAEARRVLDEFGAPHTGFRGTGRDTHLLNSGHGISQHTLLEQCARPGWRQCGVSGAPARPVKLQA